MDRYKIIRYFAYTIEILILYMVQETPGLLPEIGGARPVLLIPAAQRGGSCRFMRLRRRSSAGLPENRRM